MKETTRQNEKMKGFVLGLATSLVLVLLMGAVRHDSTMRPVTVINDPDRQPAVLLRNGRYQITAMAMNPSRGGNGCGVFIVDTTTGVTRPVYASLIGKKGRQRTVNNLGRSFAEIR